jgi:hypothetical protein
MKGVSPARQTPSDEESRFAEIYKEYGKLLHAYCARRTLASSRPMPCPRSSWLHGRGSTRSLQARPPSHGSMAWHIALSPIIGDPRHEAEGSSHGSAAWPK